MSQPLVNKVFQCWRNYRPNPAYCRLTPNRVKLINARLNTYSSEELCVLIRYAHESDAAEARFWRGENDRKAEYLDLTNLFRSTKIDGRIERAMLWRDDQKVREYREKQGVDLGAMGLVMRFRGEA